jgi:hypothetical protein
MNDDFEQKLQRQPLQQIPGGWREEILATAGRKSKAEGRKQEWFWPSSFVSRLSTILWPSPVAWAGLAAVWILIVAVDFSMRDPAPVMAEKSTSSSPEVIVELKQQQRLLAELMGPRDTADAARQKTFSPKPRSECVEFLAT